MGEGDSTGLGLVVVAVPQRLPIAPVREDAGTDGCRKVATCPAALANGNYNHPSNFCVPDHEWRLLFQIMIP